jgi:molecular chaperone DnaJ
MFQKITTCAACRGHGQVIEEPCLECGGRGEVEREEKLTVNIPVGVEEGMALRVPGHGLPSGETRGTPGDLFVVVHTARDPRFERDGIDLWRREKIQIADAVLGTSLDVPTLDGRATVTIPPGTQPDAVLRLKGKGLPEFGGRRRGDLYLRVGVHVPERVGAEEKKLYERLRTLGRKNRRDKSQGP